jgi:anion-transporting  ArsA/GET3 family ATPase
VDLGELGPVGRGLLSKKLLFVTGKGGVGKSTVAGALGRITSKLGAKTLICEVDAKGDVGRLFGVDDVTFAPTQVAPIST